MAAKNDDNKEAEPRPDLSVPRKQSVPYKTLMNTSTKNWKSTQFIPGVASDAETESIDKLYAKFKEISNLKGLIQTTMNNLDKEYLNEQEKLNNTFNSIIQLLENRKNNLLNNMKNDVINYKKELNEKLTLMTKYGHNLNDVKKKYEENIKNEKLNDVEQRTKMNVKMINESLNKIDENTKKIKPKHPTFIINENRVKNDIANCGNFILKVESPPAPIINILLRTSESAMIEILFDEKYNNDPILRYELDIYKGAMDNPLLVKDDEYLTTDIITINDDNICFYKINDLDDNEEYHVRARGILKDDNLQSKFSKWIQFKTKQLNSDDENDKKMNDFVPYNAEDESKLEQAWKKNMENETLKKNGINHFASWLLIFKRIDLGITLYQQKRVFFCMQYLEEGPNSKIDSGDFANFILNVGQRFDSKQYHNFCHIVRSRILKK